jgi:P-type Cu+ transporter
MLKGESVVSLSTCFHCGDSISTETINLDEHIFCCQGCSNVYELLSKNNLCDFYTIDENAGLTQTVPVLSGRFDYLNDIDVRKKLIDFTDGHISKVTFFIPSIHCSSCIWLIEKLNKIDARIKQSRVHFTKKEIYITYSTDMQLSEVVLLLARLGYEPAIHLNQLEDEVKKENNNSLLYKIGVAGFCFGNIMLISFPEYFGLDSATQKAFSSMFGWLNFTLSLPVFFYSASDYFVKAKKQIMSGNVGIDIPLALGILVMFVRSTYEVASHTGTGYFDTHAGLVFFLLIGKWFQQKTYEGLSFERDYKSYFPIAVSVIKNGLVNSTPVSKLAIGDRIIIKNNELIPADAILLKGDAWIDYSFVTGESDPVNRGLGEMVFAGGKQTGQTLELEVTKAVSQSYLTQLWNNETFSKHADNRLGTFQQMVSRYFTYALLFIALSSAAVWLYIGSPSTAIHVFTSVLIIACPCALALSSPFALGTALHLMGKKGFYIKSPEVIEHMAKTDVVVFDKTGTITQPSQSTVQYEGGVLDAMHEMVISNMTSNSIHPISKQIHQYVGKQQELVFDSFKEIPNKGLTATFRSDTFKIGSASHVKIALQLEQNEQLVTRVYFSINDNVLGSFILTHAYRIELAEVLNQISSRNQIHLLSGDNDKQRTQLSHHFDNSRMQFNQTPEDKLNYIAALKSNHIVMMVGDGLNDAGALKAADVGISITEDTSHFTPASDIIFDASSFGLFPNFMRFANSTLHIIYGSFVLSLLYNIVGLFFAVQGLLSPLFAAIIMPLSSITIILFTTLGTTFMAHKNKIK